MKFLSGLIALITGKAAQPAKPEPGAPEVQITTRETGVSAAKPKSTTAKRKRVNRASRRDEERYLRNSSGGKARRFAMLMELERGCISDHAAPESALV